MLISGVQPFTVLDYPGKVACIFFVAGCNFRCGYCHNPEFVLPEKIQKISKSFLSEETIFRFLGKRRGLLEGVVISGGEPTVHAFLPQFIRDIRSLGFLVKLDTNGNNPAMLEKLFSEGLLDYVAMDMKTSPENYPDLMGPLARPENIRASIDLIQKSGVEYEFRSTLLSEIHTSDILKEMGRSLSGAKTLYIQTFRPQTTLDPAFAHFHPFSREDMQTAAEIFFLPFVQSVSFR